MKRILFATSEAVPFIKTGGLADVAGALPKCFDKRYFDVRVILPKYACMKQEWKDKMEYITHFYMDLGYKNCYVGIMHMAFLQKTCWKISEKVDSGRTKMPYFSQFRLDFAKAFPL